MLRHVRLGSRIAVHLTTALALLGSAGMRCAQAYSGGPPDGFANDPPVSRNCTACHSSFAVNSGNGAFTLSGLPLSYTPDSLYTISVHLVDPGQRRWGFELTPLLADGTQAGELLPIDPTKVQVSEGPGDERDYAKQTLSGTYPNATGATWLLQWTPPTVGSGTVTIYASGNAANNNGNTAFDYVYTLARALPESVPTAVEVPIASIPNFLVFPNPARGVEELRVRTLDPAASRWWLVSPTGRRIELHAEGDGSPRLGLPRELEVAPGIYWLSRVSGDGTSSQRLVLSR